MFESFDFSVLDDPSFKEDAVREEIVAPILSALGYRPTGPHRVVRSKTLKHPFVMIGSRKYPVNIVPDYTLILDDVPRLILDAKSPREPVVNSHHVEQAFSYAIHPEIRAGHYALCNGRSLAVYQIDGQAPFLDIPVSRVDEDWKRVEEAIGPRYLSAPHQRGFMPDYGMTFKRIGLKNGISHIFIPHYLQGLIRVDDTGLHTGFATTMLGDVECLITFDFSQNMIDALLSLLPPKVSEAIRHGLSRQPYRVDLRGQVVFSCEGVLGEAQTDQNEIFIPVIVSSIGEARYDPSVRLSPSPSRG